MPLIKILLGILYIDINIFFFLFLSTAEDNVEIFTRSGDTVIIPCNQTMPTASAESPGYLPFLLQWVRTDLPYPFFIGFGPYPPYIDEQYNGRISVNKGTGDLKIEEVRPEDDGRYECQIIVLDGNFNDMENGTFTHLVVIGKIDLMLNICFDAI